MLDWTADVACAKHREFLVGWTNWMLTNLERWLTGRDYVASKGFTVADILMAHVLLSGKAGRFCGTNYLRVDIDAESDGLSLECTVFAMEVGSPVRST